MLFVATSCAVLSSRLVRPALTSVSSGPEVSDRPLSRDRSGQDPDGPKIIENKDCGLAQGWILGALEAMAPHRMLLGCEVLGGEAASVELYSNTAVLSSCPLERTGLGG